MEKTGNRNNRLMVPCIVYTPELAAAAD